MERDEARDEARDDHTDRRHDAAGDPADDWARDEFDEDHSPEDDAPPYWFHGQHLPDHARRMGLTSTVPDGALLDFAGSLDGAKRLHRVTAWVLLVVFGLPVVFAIMRVVVAFSPW